MILRAMLGFIVCMGAGFLIFIGSICYSVLSNRCS